MRKHPHGCGEDTACPRTTRCPLETPPRVWGRPPAKNDSTAMAMKHPHGCGEDADRPAAISAGSETPPRVWGRLPAVCDGPAAPGNTPTGVGKTAYLGSATDFNMKHPHGCGEDQSHESRTGCDLETPPRVWGRPDVFRPRLGLHRNTPTGVGKTSFWMQHVFKVEKHPHGCGEDPACR